MATIITNYTTYDLAYYYADLKRLPRLSREERQHLVTGTLHEFPTRSTKLSQYCHGCRTHAKKSLAQRWHQCACGIGPIQRDLYSAFLAAYLDPPDYLPSSAQYHRYWEGADLRLRAALERLYQRAKEGQVLPRSVGITHARARLPQRLATNQQGLVYRHGRLETLG